MRNYFAENNSSLASGITVNKLVGPNAQRSAAWPVDFEQTAFDYFMRDSKKAPAIPPARRPGPLQRRVGREVILIEVINLFLESQSLD
jgi:hypothetical protein